MNEALHYALFPTSMGWVGALASTRGLRKLTLPVATPEQALRELGKEAAVAEEAPQQFAPLQQRVEAFFQGERTGFDVKLDTEGYSPFFSCAWQACASIPAGETRSLPGRW